MPTYTKKWEWALNGALIGFLIAWLDMTVEWRSVSFADWRGIGIAHNVGHFLGAMTGGAIIGWIAGTIRDHRMARTGRLTERPIADDTRTKFFTQVGIVGRLGLMLYWTCAGIALVCVVGALGVVIFATEENRWWLALVCALAGVFVYGLGAGSRFVLAGPRPKGELGVSPLADRFSWRPLIATVALAAVLGLGRAAYDSYRDPLPGLWGNKRTEFVTSASASCERTQAAHPDNKGVTREVIRAYCKCFADGMADRVSVSDMKVLRDLPKEGQQTMMLAQHRSSFEQLGTNCAGSLAGK